MRLDRRRILITGADGFIGSHLAEELVRRGHGVRALVWYNAFGREGWLEHAEPGLRSEMEVVFGDIRDPHSARRMVEGCDVVMHLAALIGIPYSYDAPQSYVDTNMTGTLNVLQAARDLDIDRVVVTSTSEVYGTAQTVPITEDHPLCGQSPYAATKIGSDQLALSFHKSFDMPVTVLRPFNTYGPRQSTRAVIPTIIAQLAAGKERISLGSTTPTRDLLYVEDTARAFIAAAEADAAVGDVIHVGTGHETSIGDLATIIGRLFGVHVGIDTDENRVRPENSEVERLLCDPTKAREVLGWTPELAGAAGLEEGLRRTISWFTGAGRVSAPRAEAYCV